MKVNNPDKPEGEFETQGESIIFSLGLITALIEKYKNNKNMSAQLILSALQDLRIKYLEKYEIQKNFSILSESKE